MLPGKTGLNVQAAEEGGEARKTQRGEHYKKQPSKPRKKLNINDVVHVQEPTGRKRWLPFQAKVIEINPNGRSYKIEMSNGFQTTKNRRHLMLAQKIEENIPDVAFEEDDPVTLDDIIKADNEYNPDSESDEEDESPEEFQIEPDNQSQPAQPAQHAEPEQELRRSERQNKGVRNHSCTGCCRLRNYPLCY